ncbi:hypothetical protein RvY_01957 [Ramazzottius varieornatus]|uniref:DDE Tnp4 domain-containing protein n=1 Tax=Ramazzottius varieornatus TaxID=947166 RepID=A0A1D1UI73_RAMVA|nr:hypothetical protein RvY_01957 [Ramazzottius varieornatus]
MNLDLDEDDDYDVEVDVTIMLLQLVSATRYLQRPEVPKSKHFVQPVFPFLDDERFKEEVRMSCESFETVLRKIEGHDAFHRPSNNSQSDPRLQLLICAYRFRSSGSSLSVGKTARRFGVSEGFVILCTGRYIEALLSLGGSEITWPNKKERASIKVRVLALGNFVTRIKSRL